MRQLVQRDDGTWLVGRHATEVSLTKPDAPFASLRAAMAAIDRYRLVATFYAPHCAQDGFTIFSVS